MLKELIDQFYLENQKNKEQTRFYITDAGKCPRAILCMGSENYVLDIKSINSMLFRKLTAPKEENIYQVQLYMHYFNIKKGMLLYVDKDQQELKEFIFDYDGDLCKSLLDKFYA